MALLSKFAGIELPQIIEFDVYRALNPDIAHFNDEQLLVHYLSHGQGEGRDSNTLTTRMDFAGLVPENADALEIGPFYSPILKSKRTKYFDVLSKEKLVARAKIIGVVQPNVPKIDFVSDVGDLSVVDHQFDAVLSSHCLEHQPDLIRHLRQVEQLLRDGGRYFLLIPDKRYCFDHFLSESTAADVLDAHALPARVHSLRNVINHRAFTCHNDGERHWAGDHGSYLEDHEIRVRGALAEYKAGGGGYIDVHAWFFTPDSIREMLTTLKKLELISLSIERLYPTRLGANEFWMVLKK